MKNGRYRLFVIEQFPNSPSHRFDWHVRYHVSMVSLHRIMTLSPMATVDDDDDDHDDSGGGSRPAVILFPVTCSLRTIAPGGACSSGQPTAVNNNGTVTTTFGVQWKLTATDSTQLGPAKLNIHRLRTLGG